MQLTAIFGLIQTREKKSRKFFANKLFYKIKSFIALILLTGCGEVSLIDSQVINDGLNAFLSDETSPFIKTITSSISNSIDRNFINSNIPSDSTSIKSKQEPFSSGTPSFSSSGLLPTSPIKRTLPITVDFFSYDIIAKLKIEEIEEINSLLKINKDLTSVYKTYSVDFGTSPINSLLNLGGETLPRKVIFPAFSIDSTTDKLTIKTGLLVLKHDEENILKLNFYTDRTSDINVDSPYLSIFGNSLLFVPSNILSSIDETVGFYTTLSPNAVIGLIKKTSESSDIQFNAFSAGVLAPSKLNDDIKRSTLTYRVVNNSAVVLMNESKTKSLFTYIEKSSFALIKTSDDSIILKNIEINFKNDTRLSPVINISLYNFLSSIVLTKEIIVSLSDLNVVNINIADLQIQHSQLSGLTDSPISDGTMSLQFFGKNHETLTGLIHISSKSSILNNKYWIFGAFSMERKIN